MTTWQNVAIPNDDNGNPMFRGLQELRNDKDELLGSVMWFFTSGPYYAYAMDAKDTTKLRRIGPCETLEGARRAVDKAITGKYDLSGRAAYNRAAQ